jgi:uncharacterized membrane protein YdjX (TVP38/TMEM64 family)
MHDRRLSLTLGVAVLVLLVAATIALWHSHLGMVFSNREALLQWVRTLGPWGPVLIVVAELLQVILAPIPGQVVGLVAGYLYGILQGTVFCSIGLSLGSLCAMGLARRYGRPLVERLASKDLLQRIDGYAQRRGAMAFLLIWLLPFLPDDLACFAAGLTRLPLGELFILALIGRTPGIIVSTVIGAQSRNLTWPQMAMIGSASLALALLFWRYQGHVERLMFRIVGRSDTS